MVLMSHSSYCTGLESRRWYEAYDYGAIRLEGSEQGRYVDTGQRFMQLSWQRVDKKR